MTTTTAKKPTPTQRLKQAQAALKVALQEWDAARQREARADQLRAEVHAANQALWAEIIGLRDIIAADQDLISSLDKMVADQTDTITQLRTPWWRRAWARWAAA